MLIYGDGGSLNGRLVSEIVLNRCSIPLKQEPDLGSKLVWPNQDAVFR